MSLLDIINRVDKRYAWSLLGFVLAVAFGLLTIYIEFIRDNRPQLRFEIISDASVLDVREKVGNLEIIYDGVDIEKAQKSLRVIVLRLTNEGANDILKSHYDEKTPLGFRILKGTLLRAEILSGSNSYLGQTLRVHVQAPDTAVFEPIIFEANEWFTVKSLILHPEGTRPALQPIGKIAGVREIQRVDSTEVSAEATFLVQTFAGRPWIQATRLIAYFLGLIVLAVCIIVPTVITSGALSKRKRRQHVTQFKSISKLKLTDQDEFIFERYIERDILYIRILQRAAGNERRLDYQARRFERRRQSHPVPTPTANETLLAAGWHSHFPIEDMQKSGFIVNDGDRWHIDPHLKQTLEEFIRFLEIKRAT